MERIEAGPASIERAVRALRAGEVIAYPTETVYGLGTDPFNATALERLFNAKGRDRHNPVLLIVSDPPQLTDVVAHVSDRAHQLMEAFWPGPLSLLLPRNPSLPLGITAGSDKVCVRCPGLEWARSLCATFGGAVTSTSANRSGEPPVQSVVDLDLAGVSLAIDAGPLGHGTPSTIVDPETGKVLREGAITSAQLESFLRDM